MVALFVYGGSTCSAESIGVPLEKPVSIHDTSPIILTSKAPGVEPLRVMWQIPRLKVKGKNVSETIHADYPICLNDDCVLLGGGMTWP